MKCRRCGNELTHNAKFCKYCGTPVEQAADRRSEPGKWVHTQSERRIVCPACGERVKPGKQFCTFCGSQMPVGRSHCEQYEETYAEPPQKKKGKKSPIIFFSLSLIIIVMLTIAVGFYFWGNQKPLKDTSAASEVSSDNNIESIVQEAVTDTANTDEADATEGEAAESIQEENNRTDLGTDNSAGVNYQSGMNSSGSLDEEFAAEAAVSSYLRAYIEDIQNGVYEELYSAVESGSKMEESQKKFIKNSELYEELLDCIYSATTRIDSKTYHITTIEEYYVLSNESGVDYYLKQKCVYEVRKQADGTWKVADYVGLVEQLEKDVY